MGPNVFQQGKKATITIIIKYESKTYIFGPSGVCTLPVGVAAVQRIHGYFTLILRADSSGVLPN